MFLSRHATASRRECDECECAYIPSRAIRAFWMALTNVVHDCMTRVSINVYEVYIDNR